VDVEWVSTSAQENSPSLVVDTIKRAEDSDAIIVRLYEAHNARGKAQVEFGFPVKKAFRCDLLENEQENLPVTDNSITLDVRPFEIITLKLV
jgi:alpha-mannosidase